MSSSEDIPFVNFPGEGEVRGVPGPARPAAASPYGEADALAEWIFQNYVKPPPSKAAPFAELRDRLCAALSRAPCPPKAAAIDPLWCVHVRGPDDLQAVTSYADAARLADGLNWWWQSRTLSEHDPIISAVPMPWEGTEEAHVKSLAQLGARGADYAMPTVAQVEALRDKVIVARVAAALATSPSTPSCGGRPAGWRWSVRDGLPLRDAEYGERWLITWSKATATADIACIDGDWTHGEQIKLLGMDAWMWLMEPHSEIAPPTDQTPSAEREDDNAR